MKTVMIYSEAGGVSKTTAAVSIAATAAMGSEGVAPRKVVLIDLDPRAKTTAWTGVEPATVQLDDGRTATLDVGSILAEEDPTGWATDVAVPCRWSENLRVIPSSRSVSNRESDRADFAEGRLKASLVGLDADLVVIDCPNRQGGALTVAALHAADSVLYAATATDSGVDGVRGAQQTVRAFKRSRAALGGAASLAEAGIVVTRDAQGAIWAHTEDDSIDEMRDYGDVLTPFIPKLNVVTASRLVSDWYGAYRKGAPVRDAYTEIMRKVTL